MREYENMRTADIVAEELLDWKIDKFSVYMAMV
jgi:hypothetical protein